MKAIKISKPEIPTFINTRINAEDFDAVENPRLYGKWYKAGYSITNDETIYVYVSDDGYKKLIGMIR